MLDEIEDPFNKYETPLDKKINKKANCIRQILGTTQSRCQHWTALPVAVFPNSAETDL